MYDDLYHAWRQDTESPKLGRLPPDFYVKAADYLRRLKEESRMLDKRTVKAGLIESEIRNVKRMLRELIRIRYRKLIKKLAESQEVPPDSLTTEERKMCTGLLPFAETYRKFARSLLQGRIQEVDLDKGQKHVVLRFLKDIPAVIGVDMKTYGPFRVEDVASLPIENARVMVKQGLAKIVEVI
ncbi:MAG: DNA replication complex subunit Gins51 [Candidatus Bathycorpusculaceae bacterium]